MVEHMFVRLLQLREVDVLLDRLVLRAKLRQAARRMHLAIERGGVKPCAGFGSA